MANKEYELAIRIAGMIDSSLESSCNLTKKQLRSVAKEAASANKDGVSFLSAMNNAGSGIDSMWNGATTAVKTTAEVLLAAGAAAGVAGGIIINMGSDFESAFAGVKKTVDATDQQLADLEEGLRDMAKNKPQTAVELAEIAEAAGQLGIQTDNIEEFTDVMADLKVATNLGDEGASQFAKFANITNMAQDKFGNLGSTVVELGNNMATTESDIVDMAMRLAGAGTQVKMSEADIMGFSAALSSVGIEAEMGGSAMSKMMINMQLAVETGLDAWKPLEETMARTGHTAEDAENAVAKGGSALKNFAAATGQNSKQLRESVKAAQKSAGSLQDFADVANMTSEEFSAAFKDDAAKALSAFISGLNDTDRLGQSAIVTLDSMDIKEVRLRDTLLRAANASGLFNTSLDMANSAFKENTALTKEAEQRYATFESRVDMIKNRVTDMGITFYQSFRDPLSDCLDVAMQFTANDDFLNSESIENAAKSFKKNIPTVVRELGEAKDAVMDFAAPVIELGDWMIENPDVIAGGLAGIGTTIAALKVAQTVTQVATAMNALRIAMMSNPVTAAIGIAALAGGAIVGISTKMKIANAEIKKQNLAEHFGDISLTLGELQEVASQIIGKKVIKDLSLAMGELEKVSDIAKDLSNSSESLNKLSWKTGMGLELNDSDKDTFKKSIDSMVENSIDLVEQAQYTARVNVKALFGEGSETGQELINGFDSMYAGINTEVSILGRQLGEAYNKAMEDGIINTDEAKIIQELQEKLANITEQVAQSQSEAKYERIVQEYSFKEMNPDTFKNQQKELQDQTDELLAATRQSWDYTLGTLMQRRKRSESGDIDKEDPNYLTQAGYNELLQKTNNQYAAKQVEIGLNPVSFGADTIKGAYKDELAGILPEISDMTNRAFVSAINNGVQGDEPLIDWAASDVGAWLNMQGLSNASRENIKDLWDTIEPQFKELLEQKKLLEAAGKDTEAISEKINSAAAIGAVAGSRDAMYALLGESAKNNPKFQEALTQVGDAGGYIPEQLSMGISNNIKAVNAGVDSLYSHAQECLQSKFGNMTVYGSVDFNMEVGNVTTRQSSTANPNGGRGGDGEGVVREVFQPHAKGGIFDTPHYGVFAEAGPEAFIPIDGSDDAKSIWQETGEALGVYGSASSSNSGNATSYGNMQDNSESKITYSPVYNVYGSSEETVKKATRDDYQNFEKLMQQYEKNNRRLNF